eukprot:scaffold46626_cov145-Amphora_coffeaeformis.AAC.2
MPLVVSVMRRIRNECYGTIICLVALEISSCAGESDDSREAKIYHNIIRYRTARKDSYFRAQFSRNDRFGSTRLSLPPVEPSPTMKQNLAITTAILATSIQVGYAFTSPLVKSPQRTSLRPRLMNHLSSSKNPHRIVQAPSSQLRMTTPVLEEEEKVDSINGIDASSPKTRTRKREDYDRSEFNIEDYHPT